MAKLREAAVALLVKEILAETYRPNQLIGDKKVRLEEARCRWCERTRHCHHEKCPLPSWEQRAKAWKV